MRRTVRRPSAARGRGGPARGSRSRRASSARGSRIGRGPGGVAARRAARDDTAIELRGIECQVRIGVEHEERARPQRVVVDLALEGNLAGSDGTLYESLAGEVKRFLGEGSFVLVETTILKLARLVFRRTRARLVTVRLRKFVLPETDHVAIEMTFRRREVYRTLAAARSAAPRPGRRPAGVRT